MRLWLFQLHDFEVLGTLQEAVLTLRGGTALDSM